MLLLELLRLLELDELLAAEFLLELDELLAAELLLELEELLVAELAELLLELDELLVAELLLELLTLPLELVPLEVLLGRLLEELVEVELPLLGVLPLDEPESLTFGRSCLGAPLVVAGGLLWLPELMLPALGLGLTVALGASCEPPLLCAGGGVPSWP